MVANLTIGKKKYAEVEERMRELAAAMSAYRSRFVNDIDRDAEAYRQVMEAYRLPKESETEMVKRNEAIQLAMTSASLVPMEVAENALEMLILLAETLEKGNSNTVTDGLVGAMTCRTAIMGALFNVRTNLGGITDENFVGLMNDKCDRMEREALTIEEALIRRVKTQLG